MLSRAAVAGAARRAAAILVFALCLPGAGAGCGGDRKTRYPELVAAEGVVAVDVSGIENGSGRFHSYRAAVGRSVDFFVYRESSGEPRAVLDACRTCYRWKKGYRLERDEVVCIKCDMRFGLDGLARGTGSCVPIALKAARRADRLEIPVLELEAGSRFF